MWRHFFFFFYDWILHVKPVRKAQTKQNKTENLVLWKKFQTVAENLVLVYDHFSKKLILKKRFAGPIYCIKP